MDYNGMPFAHVNNMPSLEANVYSTKAGTLMEPPEDRRIDLRLPLKLAAICQKVGQSSSATYTATTLNVSPGGMLMEVNTSQLREGQLLSLEMSLPPTEGLLEFGGRFSTYARVVRVQPNQADTPGFTHKVALEFCQSIKLRV